ncbi:hypothetical protein ACFV4F_37640 [Kitasatospora sp. NPDC059722]|uniref:hypothetical protein n=1 Tax=unclassified Kitasatospora TaxID=2633591 RepID=UPI00364E56C4
MFQALEVVLKGHGGFTQPLNAAGLGLNDKSVVLTQICELGPSADGELVPVMGEASMRIDNVAQMGDVVWVRGSVGWDSDLAFRITLFAVL